MYSLCLLTSVACVLTLLLTPAVRKWSLRMGLVDRPDQARKIHRVATPRTGGIPILAAYAGAHGLLLLLPLKAGGQIAQHLTSIRQLLPAVAVVFCTGLLDDWIGLRPWQKLLGEMAAAAWAFGAGVRILGVSNHPAPIWLSFVTTVA